MREARDRDRRRAKVDAEKSHSRIGTKHAAEREHVPRIREPNPECAICGRPIPLIAEAISEGDGRYSHFDCVLSRIKEEYNVQPNEKVSYIGRGSFAVVAKNPDGGFYFRERIEYEGAQAYSEMKKFVESTKE